MKFQFITTVELTGDLKFAKYHEIMLAGRIRDLVQDNLESYVEGEGSFSVSSEIKELSGSQPR